jgi:hypothetical protein
MGNSLFKGDKMPTIPYVNLQGKRLPGVTTVLGSNLGWSKGALMWWAWNEGMEGRNFKDTSGRAADAGTLAHYLIECDLTGQEVDLAPFPLPKDKGEQEQLMIQAETGFNEFLMWKKTYKLKPLKMKADVIKAVKSRLHPKIAARIDNPYAIELNLVSEKYQYGFTIDIVGTVADSLCIIDIKTATGTYEDHIVQLAAYAKGWEEVVPEYPVDQVHLLRLGKTDASFHHHHWADLNDEWEAFLEARSLHDRHKRIKKRT